MRIAIFGVGGVGGYFGGCLTKTEHEVIFIARGKHLAEIQQNGLQVDNEQDNFIAKPTLATDAPAQVGTVDLIVVATKAWQIHDAAEAMRPMIGTNTLIIPLLNGVEAPLILGELLGEENVLGGFCRVMSRIEAPGHIVQGGTPPFVSFGEMDGSPSDRVQAMRELFESAEITVQTPASIQAAMWQKLLFIASFGGVGSVTRMPVGVLREQPETREMLLAAMTEVKAVAEARQVPMTEDAVQRGIDFVDTLPPTATASMQRDILGNYPSELDAQNGAVVRLGQQVNVDAPTHRFIYHALLPSERAARGQLTIPE